MDCQPRALPWAGICWPFRPIEPTIHVCYFRRGPGSLVCRRLIVLVLRDELATDGELQDPQTLLVAAERQPLVQTRGLLTLQFSQRPTFGGGFDLVEAAFVEILNRQEQDVMGPTEREWLVRSRSLSRRVFRFVSRQFSVVSFLLVAY